MARVPVIVLSGGLGSGKTTLLNHVLRTTTGRVGVVVNDFGQVNVDALLLRGQVDTRAITGGCLCCLADTSELDDALRRLSRLDLDAIVVEASGLAEPRELARMVVASEVPGVRFGGVVELVDAAAWEDGPAVAPDHLKVASLLVVTKPDRAAAPVEQIVTTLTTLAPGTSVATATHGVLDPGLLFDVADRPEPTGQLSLTDLLVADGADAHADHDHKTHAHEAYRSAALDAHAAVHPGRLVALLDAPPPGTYRTKGVLDVAGVGFVVVHGVGGWFTIERAEAQEISTNASDPAGSPDEPGPTPRTSIVVIGPGLDAGAARVALEALLLRDGEVPDPAALHAVRRHLRARSRRAT